MIDDRAPLNASRHRLADMPLVESWPVKASVAECPHWIGGTNSLLWIDGVRPSVNLLDLTTGISTETIVPAKIGSAAPGPDGTTLLALKDALWLQDSRAELHPCAAPDMTGTHFNDGKCDPLGRFWVGSRSDDGSPGKGSLYRLDPDGRIIEMANGFDVCNGLAWSPDATAFYFVDTVPRLLYRYDYDLTLGTIANRQVIQDFAGVPGKPDGLAVDIGGNIWCAMWDGAGIQRLSPDGERIGWLDTPCPRPTSCAFGGDDGRMLLVTSASYGLHPADIEQFGLSGSILAFRSPVAGVPVAAYAGPGIGSTQAHG
ncbi:SMP-30/gluconolactonase/LRE family protein [Sphingomonas sp. JC676]|uniref:SMP-30/gluconolactonase/LRE family protein n=1 Tax=Sphingomonas sp. JC676 TaxID=2768065 RepID=UPI0016583779|nr:SMP-30/gluconolactonase/LRE family protein [Sphingomonas sp. JC676]MBC9034102.1 SMP-30/gluconolactonase/LRE family protein [Sphingomonas sp. JC676]